MTCDQQTALEQYKRSWLQLDAMSDEELDGPAGALVADASDRPWHAMGEEGQAAFKEWVKTRDL